MIFRCFRLWQIGPGGLRAPCVLACAMRSLVIVITIIQSFSPFFFFLRLLLLTHFGETPVCEIISPQYIPILRARLWLTSALSQQRQNEKFIFYWRQDNVWNNYLWQYFIICNYKLLICLTALKKIYKKFVWWFLQLLILPNDYDKRSEVLEIHLEL